MTYDYLFFYVQGKAPAEDDGNNEKEGNFDEDWSTESDEDGETRPPPNVRSKGGPVIKG